MPDYTDHLPRLPRDPRLVHGYRPGYPPVPPAARAPEFKWTHSVASSMGALIVLGGLLLVLLAIVGGILSTYKWVYDLWHR